MLSNAAFFTNLRSLHCPAGNTQPATAGHVTGLSVLAHLTSLTLTCLARQAVPALAELAGGSLAGTLRSLALSLDPREGREEDGEEAVPLAQLLPLSSLSRLTALGTPWELFKTSPSSDCTHLAQLASLSVDFHCLSEGEYGCSPRILYCTSALVYGGWTSCAHWLPHHHVGLGCLPLLLGQPSSDIALMVCRCSTVY